MLAILIITIDYMLVFLKPVIHSKIHYWWAPFIKHYSQVCNDLDNDAILVILPLYATTRDLHDAYEDATNVVAYWPTVALSLKLWQCQISMTLHP